MADLDFTAVTDRDLIAEMRKRMEAGDIEASDLDIELECNGACLGDDDAGGGIDMHCVDEARSRFMRREYRETLWNLEKALGAGFAGLSDIDLEPKP